MAAGNTPTILDPKDGINPDVQLQSGDPPASFTEGDDKYTAPAGEAGARVLNFWAVNDETSTVLIRLWYTESGGSRDKIAEFGIAPNFRPEKLEFLIDDVMDPGDILEVAANTASALRVKMSVMELKD